MFHNGKLAMDTPTKTYHYVQFSMLANVNEEEKNKMNNKNELKRVFCLSKSTTMSSVSASIDIIDCFFLLETYFSMALKSSYLYS